MKIALTGGLATGKSEALRLLRPRLSSYKIVAYEDLLSGLFCLPEFRAQAPQAAEARSFDELCFLLFCDERTCSWFNGFVDKWLGSRLEQLLAENSHIVVEVPRLLESSCPLGRFDYIVSMAASGLDQHEALMRLTALPSEAVSALMHSEHGAELRSVCCDFALLPHGPGTELSRQVDQLVADVHRTSLRLRAERFFGTQRVWDQLEDRLDQLPPPLKATTVLAGLFEVFSRHQSLVLNARSVELALWFVLSGAAGLSLANAPAWCGQSVRDMWGSLRRHCPSFLEQGETVALAAQMLLSSRLGQVVASATSARPHWQRDIEFFLDLPSAYFSQMPAPELLAYACDVERVMAGKIAPGESFCTEAFSRWHRLGGAFHRTEMAQAYGARLAQLMPQVDERFFELSSPCYQGYPAQPHLRVAGG